MQGVGNMIFFLIFGIAMLLPGIFYIFLTLRSVNPKNLISTTGELSRQKGYKNYKLKNGTTPNATQYSYTYLADGKAYHLRGVRLTHSRNLRKRIEIVYLRGFPRCAYAEHFSGITEKLAAASLTALGILCLVLYIAFG